MISYLTKKFTKGNDNFKQDEYRKRCHQAEFPYPKSLPKKVTAQQAKDLSYNLAVKLEEVKNLTKRYLYAPIFSYKSENIITSLFHSKSLVNKHPNLPKVYHSRVQHFLNQFENLDISPANIKWLISLLSKSFLLQGTQTVI